MEQALGGPAEWDAQRAAQVLSEACGLLAVAVAAAVVEAAAARAWSALCRPDAPDWRVDSVESKAVLPVSPCPVRSPDALDLPAALADSESDLLALLRLVSKAELAEALV